MGLSNLYIYPIAHREILRAFSLFFIWMSEAVVVYRVTYKAEYEKFKMFHTMLMCVLAVLSLTFSNSV